MTSQITRHECSTFDDVVNLRNELDSKKENYILLFSGAKLSNGTSWCPDCETADPVIKKFLNETKFKKPFHYIYVGIERTFWKDMKNPFRTENKFKISCVPTLMNKGGDKKIEESECADPSMLEMLFEDFI